MRMSRHHAAADGSAPAAEVRRHGRLRCNMLNSTLGEVLDLSAAGLRVRHRGWPRITVGEIVPLVLSVASSEVRVEARIVWMRRTGFRRHEIGVEFINLDAATRSCLSDISLCAARLAGTRPEAA